MSGMCRRGFPGWESRADIVTREIIRGTDNIGGCDQTAGQGKKWGQGWRNQVICYVTGQFNARVKELLAGIISSSEALPSSSSLSCCLK